MNTQERSKITVEISADDHARWKRAAGIDERTMAAMIRHATNQHVNELLRDSRQHPHQPQTSGREAPALDEGRTS